MRLGLMAAFSSLGRGPATSASALPLDLLRRRPVRVTSTLNWALHQRLQERADYEGRSLSNLVSHLLEVGLS